MKRLFRTQGLLWTALILALVGSLTHVAWSFSTLEGGDLLLGYIQAIAVDVGLFAIALGIQANRRQGRETRVLWGGVIFFALISTYANLLHGLAFASPLDLPGWGWLVALRPFLLSAVLPILVIYLAEVAASNYGHMQDEQEQEQGFAYPENVTAMVFLDKWNYQNGMEPTVPEMVYHLKEQAGVEIDGATADSYILEWRSRNNKTGARPKNPVTAIPTNGRH